MKNILIIGSLPKDKEKTELYETVISVCNEHSARISSPIDTVKFKGSEKERYKRAFDKVKKANLIISEQSSPSTGQGMEIREATILKKPLIIIAKTGSSVSGLVKACPNLLDIIYYDNLEELKTKLNKVLK